MRNQGSNLKNYFFALYDKDDFCVGTFEILKEVANFTGISLNSIYIARNKAKKIKSNYAILQNYFLYCFHI